MRPAFTLLEVLLASGIALMLLSALYVGMDVQLRSTEEGREVVDQGTLARALLSKISGELTGCLTPITASKATLLGQVTGTNVESQLGLTAAPLNMGVQGDGGQVTVYVSAVPKVSVESGGDLALAEQQQQTASDLRRVTYWLANNGGLARQEVTRVTADDDSVALPPNVDDETKYIIAPEATALQFRYFDGTSWTDTWDGSTLGADGKTPLGPPRLIEVSLTLRHAGTQGGEAREKLYIHVVAIGAANAQPTTAGADASGSSSSTTGGSP